MHIFFVTGAAFVLDHVNVMIQVWNDEDLSEAQESSTF